MSSDAGESTSTDSDIGTSPSGTTLASPPSSPQQQQQIVFNNNDTHHRLNTSSSNYDNHQNTNNNNNNNNSKQIAIGPNNSIIRQHSYLNAVQLNDFKITHPQKSKFCCSLFEYN